MLTRRTTRLLLLVSIIVAVFVLGAGATFAWRTAAHVGGFSNYLELMKSIARGGSAHAVFSDRGLSMHVPEGWAYSASATEDRFSLMLFPRTSPNMLIFLEEMSPERLRKIQQIRAHAVERASTHGESREMNEEEIFVSGYPGVMHSISEPRQCNVLIPDSARCLTRGAEWFSGARGWRLEGTLLLNEEGVSQREGVFRDTFDALLASIAIKD